MEESLKFLIFVVAVIQICYCYQTRGSNVVCVNGTVINGRCSCNHGYMGAYCELKINCNSTARNPDGSCKSCKKNFEGLYCENVICVNGVPKEQQCICKKPYSGEFCEKLITADVYHYYNSKMASAIGPLGALTIIPLVLIYYGCEYMAKKRQVKRIEQQMSENQNVSVDSEAVKNLLGH